MRIWKFVFILQVDFAVSWAREVDSGEFTDVGPKLDERLVDLVDVRVLLGRWPTAQRHLVEVDLELYLFLNVHPEELKEVLWVLLFVEEAVLIQVDILKQSLAGMDLGLVVLAVHEDVQKASRCVEEEDLAQVGLRVVQVYILLFTRNVVNLVERVNDF